ncbi:MAG: histidine kinase [Bacteroidota bacterium]
MRFKGLLILIFVMRVVCSLYAQDPVHQRFTRDDGLPSNEIYSLYEDRHGYLWIGSDGGLTRYDGYDFITYSNKAQKSPALTSILEDKWGRIWVCNFAGQVFYVEDDSLYHFLPLESYQAHRLNHLVCLHDSILVMFAEYQFRYVDLSTGKDYAGPMVEDIYTFSKWDEKLTWTTAKGGVFRLNAQKIDTIHTPGSGKNRGEAMVGNPSLFEEFAYNSVKEVLLEIKDKVAVQIPYPQELGELLGFAAIGSRYLVGGVNGLTWMHKADKWQFDPSLMFREKSISNVLQDREGNIWLGTLDEGLIKVPDMGIRYWGDFPEPKLTAVEKGPDGTFLLGDQKGWITLWHPQKGALYRKAYSSTGGVNLIHYDAFRNGYWINGGANRGRLFKASPISGLQISPSEKRISLTISSKDVSIYKGSLIGVGSHAAHLNLSAAHMLDTTVSLEALKQLGYPIDVRTWPTSVTPSFHTSLGIWPGKRGWAVSWDSTRNPLRFWIAWGEVLEWYQKDGAGRAKSEENRDILARSLQWDRKQRLWASTSDAGIYVIEDTQVVKHLTSGDGLPSSICRKMAMWQDYAFVLTDGGLTRIHTQSYEIEVLDKFTGLLTNSLFDLVPDSSGLWTATEKGLQCIPHSTWEKADPNPQIRISGVGIWERDTLLQSRYVLEHDQNFLRVDYSGLSSTFGRHIKYRYRMLGQDSSWINVPGEIRTARFPEMTPGRYQFQVQASLLDGKTTSGVAVIDFIIKRPWWGQPIVWMLGGLALVLLMFGGFRLRVRQLKQQARIDRQLDDLRMRALQAQMNPHFIFNALNAIQHFFTEHQTEAALMYLARFARLIRTIFEHSRVEWVNLADELTFLKLYTDLEELRFGHKVQTEWLIAPEIDLEAYVLPPLLIQPVIENAFKHGLLHRPSGGMVSINFQLVPPGWLIVQVRDNGVGRKAARQYRKPASPEHRSAGLETIQERLGIHNGHFSRPDSLDAENLRITDRLDGDGKGAGTDVHLYIALKNLD